MRVVFNQLKIQNFRQIDARTFDLNPHNNYLIGANGTGKSNSLHAITWVLYGKDLDDRTKFEVVPLNPDNTRTELEPDVTLTVNADGELHELRRVLKNGKTQTYIDGAPTQTLKEFDSFVAGLFSTPDRFKMYTNPLYFPSLNWKDQRAIFMDFFPAPKTDQVIGRMEERQGFAVAIAEELKTISPDRLIHKYTLEKKEKEDERARIRAQIELLDEQLEGQQAMNAEHLEAERAELREQLRTQNEKIAEIAQANAEAERQRATYTRQAESAARDMENAKTRAIRAFEDEIYTLKNEIRNKEATRDNLRDTYARLTGNVTTVCPTCHQTLPSGQIEEKKQAIRDQKTQIATAGSALSAEIETLTAKLAKREAEGPPEPDLAEYHQIMAEAQAKIAALPAERPVRAIDGDDIARLDELDRILARADVHEENLARRVKLQDREREINREYEDAEQALREIADFLHYQAELIVEAVNQHFKHISVKVLEIQKNGEPKETFEILKDGVPYAELNTAGKLEAGQELAGFIKGQLGIECPTIIDNGERYTDVSFNRLEGQLIIAYAKQGEKLKAVPTLPA